MIVKSVELSHFRNYGRLSLSFDEKTNILYGDNAQGKTNILESLYVSGTTKSHRGSKDREMISFGENESHIRTTILKKGIEYRIDMHLKKSKAKGIAINQIPIKKASELFGILNFVFFSPEDMSIIKNGPAERRRFLDLELCQLDKVYLYHLSNYNKVLMQRNKLLKEIEFHPELEDTLSVWDMQLVSCGKKIIEIRKQFVNDLNQIIALIHSRITGGKEKIILKYEQSVSCETFEQELGFSKNRDLKLGQTHVGPHRDDISFIVNGMDIRKFGSQGQQRSAALSLKLAEIELVKKIIKDVPVLLLDDVLSELDSSRQNFLLDNIHDVQTIITCTGLDEFVKNRFQINKVFYVSEGTVTEKKQTDSENTESVDRRHL